MICVLDASFTLSWILRENPPPASDALLDRIAMHGAVVPALWRLEIANGLLVAMRRKRIDRSQRGTAIQSLRNLPLEVDQETDGRAWTDTLRLADLHGLTIYDATYLELALRRSQPLATLDRELMEAARESGVSLLPAI